MKWMQTSSRNSLRSSTTSASPFMRRVSLCLLALVGLSASFSRGGEYDYVLSDIQQNVESIADSLENGDIESLLTDVRDSNWAVQDWMLGSGSESSHNRQGSLPWYLYSLNSALWGLGTQNTPSGQWSVYGDLQTILSQDSARNQLLQQIAQILGPPTNRIDVHFQPTNIVNVTVSGMDDILASNPWWSTNSVFVANRNWFSQILPPDDSLPSTLSFPQAFSQLLSKLNQSSNQNNLDTSAWFDMWGSDGFRKWNLSSGGTGRYGLLGGYTWFDYIADWQRSNAVSSASFTSALFRELRALSNAVASSSVSIVFTNRNNVVVTNAFQLDVLTSFLDRHFGLQFTNDIENAVYLGMKIEGLSNALASSSVNITNILNADDILAANPWWATNSAFVWDWHGWNGIIPFPRLSDTPYVMSFPEAFSLFLSSRTRQIDPLQLFDFWDSFGSGDPNTSFGLYTFEDWLADAIKSNMVLQAGYFGGFDASNASQIVRTDPAAYRMGQDVEDEETEGRRQLAEQLDNTSDEMDSSSEEELEHPVWSPQDPYSPIRTKIEDFQSGLDDKLPEFNETADPVIVIFNADSGLPMDAAGRVSVNLNEAMGEWVNTCGNVMSWLWRVLNAVLTLVLVVRLFHEIGEAI